MRLTKYGEATQATYDLVRAIKPLAGKSDGLKLFSADTVIMKSDGEKTPNDSLSLA